MPVLTPHDGNGSTKGTVLYLGGDIYTVTDVVIENTYGGNNSTIDVSHLGQTTGEGASVLNKPLVMADNGSGRKISFNYLGQAPMYGGGTGTGSLIVMDGATATVKITVGGTVMVGGGTAFIATVASSKLTLKTNDAIRGEAVLTLVRTSTYTAA